MSGNEISDSESEESAIMQERLSRTCSKACPSGVRPPL